MTIINRRWILTQVGKAGLKKRRIGIAILFAETGLLIGLVFPGDSLLFVAGVAASGSAAVLLNGTQLSTTALFIGAPIAAIVGAQVGHWSGAKFGRKLFDRPDGRVFNHSRVVTTEKWLRKYGTGRAIILARFVPVVRTLINPLCGIVGIPARTFFLWNVVGAIIWTQLVMGLGYLLGERLKGSIDTYLLPIIGLIIFISLLPVFVEIFRELQTKRHHRKKP